MAWNILSLVYHASDVSFQVLFNIDIVSIFFSSPLTQSITDRNIKTEIGDEVWLAEKFHNARPNESL